MNMKKRFLLTLIAAASLGAANGWAQEAYPSRPVNLVVPLSPGITLDAIARLYADKLSKVLGQPVVVVNKPGAGGIIGAQFVAAAPADGYTLLMTNTGHVILPAMNRNLPFDTVKDFKGVALVADAPSVVIVSPTLGVSNLREFVALAKAKPGTINYASAGLGSPTHIAGAYFAQQASVSLTHVPYKMSADIVSDLLAGRVQAVFAPPAYLPTLIAEGKLRALGVAAGTDLVEPFRTPTARSQGVNYVNTTWYGVLAPSRTPQPILEKLAAAVRKVSEDPEVREKLKGQGLSPSNSGLAEFDTFIRADAARLAPLLKGTEMN